MKLKIEDVIAPSDAQKKAGILGTVNLSVEGDNGNTLCKLNGFTVRATKSDGTRFLSEPSYPVGEGNDRKYFKHYQLFPLNSDDDTYNSNQKDAMSKLTAEVIRILDDGGTRKAGAKPSAPAATTAASTGGGSDPWD